MSELKLIICTPDDFFNDPRWRALMTQVSGQSQALTDLQTAVANLQTEGTDIAELVSSLDAQLEALLSATSNPDDPQVEAAAQAINATVASLSSLISSQPAGVSTGQTPSVGAQGPQGAPPAAANLAEPTEASPTA
jgi:hypothetical protein